MIAEDRFAKVLSALVKYYNQQGQDTYMSNQELKQATGFPSRELNDVVEILVERGYVDSLRTFGTAPYTFSHARSTSLGRFEFQKKSGEARDRPGTEAPFPSRVSPVGSPYGFTDKDWNLLDDRKADPETLHVVLGLQFASEFYDTTVLKTNVKEMFEDVVEGRVGFPGLRSATCPRPFLRRAV